MAPNDINSPASYICPKYLAHWADIRTVDLIKTVFFG